MLLQTVRPNIVQAIRAYRVEDLMSSANDVGQHFLYANLSAAQSKQDVLEGIAEAFLFPAHFGKNLDALYDCMTDLVHKAGSQPGFVVVLEQLPDNPRFDREVRGRSEKYRSGASILFSSPLSGTKFLGAGYRSGSEHHREACQGGREECRRREFRHEHAADEQRVRHRDVAERRVANRLRFGSEKKRPAGRFFIPSVSVPQRVPDPGIR